MCVIMTVARIRIVTITQTLVLLTVGSHPQPGRWYSPPHMTKSIFTRPVLTQVKCDLLPPPQSGLSPTCNYLSCEFTVESIFVLRHVVKKHSTTKRDEMRLVQAPSRYCQTVSRSHNQDQDSLGYYRNNSFSVRIGIRQSPYSAHSFSGPQCMFADDTAHLANSPVDEDPAIWTGMSKLSGERVSWKDILRNKYIRGYIGMGHIREKIREYHHLL